MVLSRWLKSWNVGNSNDVGVRMGLLLVGRKLEYV